MCTPAADAAQYGLQSSGPAPWSPSPALAACSVHAWLPTFRRQALRCEVLQLPPDFLSYLTEDGLFVEPSSGAVGAFSCELQSNRRCEELNMHACIHSSSHCLLLQLLWPETVDEL